MAGCLALLTQPFVAPLRSQPPQVDAKRLEAHVRHLSVDLHSRSFDQPRNLGLAALYVTQQLQDSGGLLTPQDVVVAGTKYQNIVARFGPASGALAITE